MDKTKQENNNQQNDSILTEKNKEDYNKEKLNPADSIQNKNRQRVIDEEMENRNREIAVKTSGGLTSARK